MPYSKGEAEIHYANVNYYSKNQIHSKPREIKINISESIKSNDCLPSKKEVKYAALDFQVDDLNTTTEKDLHYAAINFHSDNSNKFKSILPKTSEIILDPLNAPNNTNEGRGNDVTANNLGVNNDNPQIEKKKSRKWLISAVAVAGICTLLSIAPVIVWSRNYISQKGINRKNCPALPAPAEGSVRFTDDTNINSEATFSCNPGSTLIQGDRLRVCQIYKSEDAGVWDGQSPKCLLDCPPLPKPADGSVTFTDGKNINSEATFTCNVGFTLVQGDRLRVCRINTAQDASVWDRQSPKCLDCPPLPAPAEGSVIFTDGKNINSEATFSCNAGFNLVQGDRVRVCQFNRADDAGVWDKLSPKCLDINCPSLPAPADGSVNFTDGKNVNSEATFSCNAGFTLVQKDRLRLCRINKDEDSGFWDGQSPECIDCPPLLAPTEGSVTFTDGKNIKSEATFSCNADFTLVQGDRLRVCRVNKAKDAGVWDRQSPKCIDINCPSLPAPADGSVNFTDGQNINSEATFSCNVGFTIAQGDRLRVCRVNRAEDSGVWDKQSPKCLDINCPSLPAPADGSVRFTDGKNVNSEATFSCNAGFTIVQRDVLRVCRINKAEDAGVWDRQSSKCIDCPPLPAPAEGSVRFTDGKNINSEATFSCNVGFTLVQGDRLRVCRVNRDKDAGAWDKQSPKCLNISCPPLPAPADGSVRLTDGKNLNSEATFSCDAGFTIVKRDILRVCRINKDEDAGVWDKQSPKCLGCPPLPAPAEGLVTFTDGKNINSEATFSCNAGFTLLPQDRLRVCRVNKDEDAGVWDKQSHKCIDCPTLLAPADGSVTFTDGKNINSKATFSCNAGFTLVQGDRLRVCRINKNEDAGVWDRQSPKCIDINCPPLLAPADGSLALTDGRNINSEATFSCNTGFTLEQGDKLRLCKINKDEDAGIWDRQSPKCIGIIIRLQSENRVLEQRINNLYCLLSKTAGITNCADLYQLGYREDRVYTIPQCGKSYPLYCDMTQDGGGWTVIQRRFDGSVNFYRNWKSYKIGFGHFREEFWLGNKVINLLTKHKKFDLLIDLEDFEGGHRNAKYSDFQLGDEEEKYVLNIGSYSGNAGNSLAWHNGMKFTTYDSDNDRNSTGNCASNYRGGFWFHNCHHGHLNGRYSATSRGAGYGQGLVWYRWKGHYYSLKKTNMKIRPMNF